MVWTRKIKKINNKPTINQQKTDTGRYSTAANLGPAPARHSAGLANQHLAAGMVNLGLQRNVATIPRLSKDNPIVLYYSLLHVEHFWANYAPLGLTPSTVIHGEVVARSRSLDLQHGWFLSFNNSMGSMTFTRCIISISNNILGCIQDTKRMIGIQLEHSRTN